MSGSSVRSVAVLLLSWNGRRHLETCLEALADQVDPGVDWEIWVWDNGSEDGTIEWLESRWGEGAELGAGPRRGRLRWVASERNLGFCGGNNELARRIDADALALLNNDTRARPEWLRELVVALVDSPPDTAAVSGRILDWEGERLDFVRGVMTFDGHAFQRGFGAPIGEVEEPEDGEPLLFPCGGNMLIRRSSFVAAGAFDREYFAYLEDVDLGWRLWSGGERVRFAARAVVHHRSMATSDLLGMFNRGFLFERNAFLNVAKNLDEELWPRLMPAVLLTYLSRSHALLVENNPGGEILTLDPYAPASAAAALAASAAPPPPDPTLWQKWRGWGSRELARRGVRKARRRLAAWLEPPPEPSSEPHRVELSDERTIAQSRVTESLLRTLAGSARRRAAIQQRRRVSDREIFERFPLAIVPTYPGDDRLFRDPGFEAWLPDDLEFERLDLGEVMAVGAE